MREAAAAKGAFAIARLQKGEAWASVTSALKLDAGRQALHDVVRTASRRQRSCAAAFTAPNNEISEAKPYFGGVTTDDGNYAVFAVTQVRNADPIDGSGRREERARKRRAEVQRGNEEFAAYVAEAERNDRRS